MANTNSKCSTTQGCDFSLTCSAHMMSSCRSLRTSNRYVRVLPIFLDLLTIPNLFRCFIAFWTVLNDKPVDSTNKGMVCSMSPTYIAWSRTLATGPPNTCVNGPSCISFIIFSSRACLGMPSMPRRVPWGASHTLLLHAIQHINNWQTFH